MRLLSIVVSLMILAGCGQPVTTVTVGQTVFDVTIADEPAEHELGLGDTLSLAAYEGMLFVFNDSQPQAFWMKGVEYPIDLIWINDGRVVGSDTAYPETGADELQFERYLSPEPVDMVLEVAAGTVAREGFVVGDTVQILD